MVDYGAADDEGVAEMHGGHGGKGVDEIAAHPYGGCVVVVHRIQEAVFRGKEPWWHARVEGKCNKSEEVCNRHGAADYCKG